MKPKKPIGPEANKKTSSAAMSEALAAALHCHQQGDLDQAERIYRLLLAQGAVSARICNNLALICMATGRLDEAGVFFTKALAQSPGDPMVLNNLASVQIRLGQFDRAKECLAKAIAAAPGLHGPHITLGNLYRKQGDVAKALAAYDRAFAISPNDPGLHNNLGLLYRQEGILSQAEESFARALALMPGYADALCSLGTVCLEQGRIETGINYFGQAIKAKPDWHTPWSSRLLALNYIARPKAEVLAAHRQWGERLANHSLGQEAKPTRPARRKIRVGYVSADFRRHSVACFIEPILAHHDRGQFDIYCYASVGRPDEVTKRLQPHASWRDIFMLSDRDAARLVRDDGIDILVDLGGHTQGSRLPLFAHQPAPMQASYLGYPNTTGLAAITYRLTDAIADPAGEEQYHTEKLERLPQGFLCFQPTAAPAIAPRCFTGEAQAITFGSCNNPAKISEETVNCWATILNRMPGSKLLLKYRQLADGPTQARLYEKFRLAGLADPETRLEMIGHLADTEAHLAMYNQVDIALDTFPYNGTTTTCEALWMGVPVVTLAGDRHAGLVGASILERIGKNGWVAGDEPEYIAKAVALAQAHEERAACRLALRDAMLASSLMDGPGFCRRLEEVYRRWLAV